MSFDGLANVTNESDTKDVEMQDISSPISHIPPELLIKIFLETLDASGSDRTRVSVVLLSISIYWRKLVLGSPEIWATIYSERAAVVKASIAYAGSMPLTITAHPQEYLQYNSDELFTAILGSLTQTRKLTLFCDWHDTRLEERFDDLWSVPAPHLEELNLRGVVLPRNLLAGSAPSLRKFSLWIGDVYLEDFPHCPLLEDLDVTLPDSIISVSSLLSTLRRSPRLKRLTTSYALNAVGSALPLGRVELPALEEISLVDEWVYYMVHLLNHLTIPVEAILDQIVLQPLL